MRSLAIALAVLPLALPLAACDDDRREGDPQRPTRIVCSDAGRVTHDDFATGDMEVSANGGFVTYVSATQEGYVRVSGTCTTYPMARPANWKPVVQGL